MQIYIQTSEIYKVYFGISQRVQYIFEIYLKYENKRARYTKFTLVFHSVTSNATKSVIFSQFSNFRTIFGQNKKNIPICSRHSRKR